jgi:hypothetical protein
VVAEVLVDRFLELGSDAILSLEHAGNRPDVAFWQYLPEAERWRFFLGYPDVNSLGSYAVYKRIQPSVPFSIFDTTSVIDSSDPRTKAFRRALRSSPKTEAIVRFRGPVPAVGYIEDAYIYRL